MEWSWLMDALLKDEGALNRDVFALADALKA
jgi:hypothetical protein